MAAGGSARSPQRLPLLTIWIVALLVASSVVVVSLSLAGASGSGIGWVQGSYVSPPTGSGASVSLANVSGGHVLVASVNVGAGYIESGGLSGSGPAALAWTKAASRTGSQSQVTLWYAVVPTAGSYTVAATATGPEIALALDEYAGVASTGTLVTSGTNAGSSQTPTATAAATAAAGSLVVGSFTWNSVKAGVTAGSGYTLRQVFGDATQSQPVAVEDRVLAGSATPSAGVTLSRSDGWVAAVVVFAPGGSTVAPTPTTGTLTGTVKNTGGTALSGAMVTVGGTSLSAATSSTGTYSIANVPAGTPSVTASVTGYTSQTQSVSVTAGATATLNFSLSAATTAPTTGTVSGQVTTTAGKAISGAIVAVGSLKATTNRKGNYSLSGVPAGTQSVTASASGYAAQSQTVSVTSGATTTANFRLSTGSTTPTTGTVSGTVKNTSGTALSGATVTVGGTSLSATTSSTGSYSIANVPSGTDSVAAADSGYTSQTDSVSVTAGGTTTANFSLSATVTTGTLSGTVKSTGGTALSGAKVVVAGTTLSVTTSSTGSYSIANVPAGTDSVTASVSGYTSLTQSVSVTAGATATLNFSLSATVTTGTVSGTVKTTGGTALGGATVVVAGTTLSVTTSSTGTYSIANVAAGTQSVTASVSGYTSQTQSVSVTAGATATLNFSLSASTPPPAAPSGLHVVGNQILDASGAVVQLHGVNRSGTEYACIQGWGFSDGPDALDSQATINVIATWHANAIRIPLNEDCWLAINGSPAAYSGANYQSAIKTLVAEAETAGLYPILELHWSAPGSTKATGQNPMPDADHSVTFWSQVAATFKGDGRVIFEPFNEPYPDNNNDTTAAWSCWKNGGSCSGMTYQAAGMQTLVTAIRTAGASNLILLGGVEYSNSLSQWLTSKPSDPANNLGAAIHVYDFNVCDTVTCFNTEYAPVAAAYPVVSTELGSQNGGTFLSTVLQWDAAHGIGYLPWTWDV
ncbi:MAG TPA: carboxypeptidase regulatory-like domain-containing protein, partial [Thermomicrobiaceae bacterium]|nr:carboxypeptidase regulatory-like domain-containing protein [Thermomicrobiaceae bacterium]